MTEQTPTPTPAPTPGTPMVAKEFGSNHWSLTAAERSRLAATLAKHGVSTPSRPADPTPPAAEEKTPSSPTPARTFDAPADPSAYQVHWPPAAFDVAADPAIAAALGAGNPVAANVALQGALRSGAQAMGLPRQIGGSVIEAALEDLAHYQSLSPAERVVYDAEQERQFSAVFKDVAAAKQSVAELVTKWQQANPTLVNALLSRGLFHSSRTFGQLALAAKRAATRSTLK